MAVNLDKPHLWKEDTRASVDHYNKWFMKFAPKAFRDTRIKVTEEVEKAVLDSNDMRDLSAELLEAWPGVLPTLRMSCCPPLAVDRLVGLAYVSKTLVKNMELGRLPVKMQKETQTLQLANIVNVVSRLIDPDIFVWIAERRARRRPKSATAPPRSSPTG
ncbi:MAG TPA: XamI family restriction endonuclease [Pirellulales bacterium]|nr:XamI family restriction endonuclease [Pirellulales bacterium]